jgi:hypothetical protein
VVAYDPQPVSASFQVLGEKTDWFVRLRTTLKLERLASPKRVFAIISISKVPQNAQNIHLSCFCRLLSLNKHAVRLRNIRQAD